VKESGAVLADTSEM